MKLVSVYDRSDRHDLLYKLLAERPETSSISHKRLPDFGDHVAFVESKPYEAWYFVMEDHDVIGACYLFKDNFGHHYVGTSIFKTWQGQGYGSASLQAIKDAHGERDYYCNLNPQNEASARMVRRVGFELVQHTYKMRAA